MMPIPPCVVCLRGRSIRDAEGPPYAPRRARELLAKDGWITGADGIRVKNGRRLQVQLAFRTGSNVAAGFALLIVEYERGVGIEVTTKRYSPEEFLGQDGPLSQGRFQVALVSYQSNYDPDASWLLSCDQRAPSGGNYARYCDPAVDRALRLGIHVPARAARRRAYSFVQRQLITDVPYDVLCQLSEVDVLPLRLQGYESPFAFAVRLSGALAFVSILQLSGNCLYVANASSTACSSVIAAPKAISFASESASNDSRNAEMTRPYCHAMRGMRREPVAAKRRSTKPKIRAARACALSVHSPSMCGRRTAIASCICRAEATLTSHWCSRARSSASRTHSSASSNRASGMRYIAMQSRAPATPRASLNVRKAASASVAC